MTNLSAKLIIAFTSIAFSVSVMGDETDSYPTVGKGERAPELQVKTWSDQKQYSLSELGGRVVVLNFTGMHCVGCEYVKPVLVEIRERYQSRPMTVLSSLDIWR